MLILCKISGIYFFFIFFFLDRVSDSVVLTDDVFLGDCFLPISLNSSCSSTFTFFFLGFFDVSTSSTPSGVSDVAVLFRPDLSHVWSLTQSFLCLLQLKKISMTWHSTTARLFTAYFSVLCPELVHLRIWWEVHGVINGRVWPCLTTETHQGKRLAKVNKM